MNRVKDVEYIFGGYNSLIVAVYKPTSWCVCKDAVDKLPKHVTQLNEKTENRYFLLMKDLRIIRYQVNLRSFIYTNLLLV